MKCYGHGKMAMSKVLDEIKFMSVACGLLVDPNDFTGSFRESHAIIKGSTSTSDIPKTRLFYFNNKQGLHNDTNDSH